MLEFTEDELDWIRGSICAYIDEGFEAAPMENPTLRSLVKKLGITKADITQDHYWLEP